MKRFGQLSAGGGHRAVENRRHELNKPFYYPVVSRSR